MAEGRGGTRLLSSWWLGEMEQGTDREERAGTTYRPKATLHDLPDTPEVGLTNIWVTPNQSS